MIEDHPITDPGVEHHVERYADMDEQAGKRATRQVLACFALAPLLALGFVISYFWPGFENVYVNLGPLNANAQHMAMGGFLGFAVLLIGVGAIQWSREIMSDEEMVEERHVAHSSADDRTAIMAAIDQGAAESGISRRKVLGSSLVGAIAVTALSPLVMLLDAGPWPLPSRRRETIERTIWDAGTPQEPIYLVNDITRTRIRAADMEIGQLINGEPENLWDHHGADFLVEKAKAAIIIVRMDPNSIKVPERRLDWHVGGIMAYSKICTHVGCPISLWEQQTHHLLCPCHQSTFDLGDAGKVVFGPAARALPQLPITVDDEGYLIARSDFTAPVGPSYFERDLYPDDKGE
ncbi:MAG: Rieske 2Fe-2S domain-containing protein [Propionibacteriaceae bacterium]|nr:Rieske 2Fe-2S domain-containing protein [Propionibacteriaceae bacterium]